MKMKNLKILVAIVCVLFFAGFGTVSAQAKTTLPKDGDKLTCETYAKQFGTNGSGYWHVYKSGGKKYFQPLFYAKDGGVNYYSESYIWIDGKEYYVSAKGNVYMKKTAPDGRTPKKDGSLPKKETPTNGGDNGNNGNNGNNENNGNNGNGNNSGNGTIGSKPVVIPANSGWISSGTVWYYSKNGVFQTGWFGDYYLDPSTGGAMAVGTTVISGQRFVFGDDPSNLGKLLKNQWYKDAATGNYYYLNNSGAAVTGWQTGPNGAKYYFYADGSLATGTVWIDGAWYNFSTETDRFGQLY